VLENGDINDFALLGTIYGTIVKTSVPFCMGYSLIITHLGIMEHMVS